MDVRAIKHAAKLSEWSEHIRVCRSSGKPVKAWCEENGINVKSYYLCMHGHNVELRKCYNPLSKPA